MKVRSKVKSLAWKLGQQLINSKRRCLNWRGDGVHSPYAFNFIRHVIRNPHPYEAYRRLYNKQEAQKLKKQYGDEQCITDRKRLELLFRIALHQQANTYYIHQAQVNELPHFYIQASGYRGVSQTIQEAELILIESNDFDGWKALKANPNIRIVILNTYAPNIRQAIKKQRLNLNPTVIFRLKGLEIWIWRRATTTGNYSVYF